MERQEAKRFARFGLFLATFLIGLREGLEASLIVGILAAFLKRNNCSLRPLIIATIAAVALSILACLGFNFFASGLPQAQQEALETVIGVIAVIFVTTMILWMNVNARNLKGELEEEAQSTLSSGGALAMAGMAFLAIIKEGLETAFFLLAVFQASASGTELLGVGGAVIGVVLAIIIGYLIYRGGVKFNLGTFFKVTGPFLILIAAGFAANVMRTGHEAGWINFGQLQVMDLDWLINGNAVVGALIQGMFSIQADPRLIEVIVYFAYLIPVMIIYLWPKKLTFTIDQRMLTKRICAGVCVVVAIAMVALAPHVDTSFVGKTRTNEANSSVVSTTLVSKTSSEVVLSLQYADGTSQETTLQHVSDGEIDGIALQQWEGTVNVTPDSSLPSSITLSEITSMNNGKQPSGLNRERTPGPFNATWTQTETISARTCDEGLVKASGTARLTANLTDGGITGSKTVSVSGALNGNWSTNEDEASEVESSLQQLGETATDYTMWQIWIPVGLVIIAVGLTASSIWDVRKKKLAANK